jgi:hypothetical protein
MALLGEVEIEHGSLELGVAHVGLDDAQVDSGFEEVGGVGVTQRVYGNSLFSDGDIKFRRRKAPWTLLLAMGV